MLSIVATVATPFPAFGRLQYGYKWQIAGRGPGSEAIAGGGLGVSL